MNQCALPKANTALPPLVWDHEPLPSGQLATLADDALGWKKSTAYSVEKAL